MRTDPAPIRRCVNPACQRPFSAVPRSEKGKRRFPVHCSAKCLWAMTRQKLAGKKPEKACRVRAQKAQARREATLRATFGVLSDRESQLVKIVRQTAYKHGWQGGYRAGLQAPPSPTIGGAETVKARGPATGENRR